MIKSALFPSISCIAFGLLAVGACSSEKPPVRTRADIAADSALAADLALVNRDTLLVDSIGQDRPAEGMVADTGIAKTTTPNPKPAAKPKVTPPAKQALAEPTAAAPKTPRPTAATTARPPAAPTPRPAATPTPRPSAVRSTARSTTGLAADKRLEGIYRALLTEMRRKEGVARGQPDPPAVLRLRAEQRAWLANRDSECRRRGGARVQCLSEFSVRRANELADKFSRLTAH